jgi:hypothetical protein
MTVVTFKVRPLGSYAWMAGLSSPFKTIFELVLWNDLHSCCHITRMSSISSKCLPFNIFFTFGREKSHWELGPVNREVVPAQLGSIKCWEVLE